MLEINRRTKAKTIVIDQGSTEHSVFEHNIIKLLLKVMLKIDGYLYTCHRNIVSSNHNEILRTHQIVYTLIDDNINLGNK